MAVALNSWSHEVEAHPKHRLSGPNLQQVYHSTLEAVFLVHGGWIGSRFFEVYQYPFSG